jgi:hypothetical protein
MTDRPTTTVHLGEGHRLVLATQDGRVVLSGTMRDGRLKVDPGVRVRTGVDMLSMEDVPR